MDLILKQNLKGLASLLKGLDLEFLSHSKKCDFIQTKSGRNSMTIDGRWLHSRVDPLRGVSRKYEHLSINGCNRILNLSGDMLYALEYLLKKHSISSGVKIYLYYPEIFIFCEILKYHSLSFLYPYVDQIYLYLAQDIPKEDMDMLYLKKTWVIENEATYKIYPEIHQIKKNYYENIEKYYQSQLTQFHFERVWIRNALKNIQDSTPKRGIIELKKKYVGQKALVVGAGPSLYHHLEWIESVGKDYTVLSTDSAYPILRQRKIEVDYVVCQDGGYYNQKDFMEVGDNTGEEKLLCDITSYPGIVRNFQNKVLFFHIIKNQSSEEQTIKKLMEFFSLEKEIEGIESGSTVTHTSISLSQYMGFSEVTLVGVDLSYPYFETHCIGGAHFYYFYERANRLNTVDSMHFEYSYPSLCHFERTKQGELTWVHSTAKYHMENLFYFKDKFTYLFTKNSYMPNQDKIDLWIQTLLEKKQKISEENRSIPSVSTDKLKEDLKKLLKEIAFYLGKIEKKDLIEIEIQKKKIEEQLFKYFFLKNSMAYISFCAYRDESIEKIQRDYYIFNRMYQYISAIVYKN